MCLCGFAHEMDDQVMRVRREYLDSSEVVARQSAGCRCDADGKTAVTPVTVLLRCMTGFSTASFSKINGQGLT